MAGTDLAVLELDTSLGVLVAGAIMPLKLASQRQTSDREVINVGAPTGFLKKGLRMSACAASPLNSFAEHPGVFPSALRNRCNGLRPGSSGSPMLDRNTNEIAPGAPKPRRPWGQIRRSGPLWRPPNQRSVIVADKTFNEWLHEDGRNEALQDVPHRAMHGF